MTTQAPQDLIVRPARESDLAYVRASWCSSWTEHATVRTIQRASPGEIQKRWWSLIASLISVGKVLVAVHPDAPEHVIGWLCYEPTTPRRLHYCHVRRTFQRLGVATRLLQEAGIDLHDPKAHVLYSHRTQASDRIRTPDCWRCEGWLLIGV